jgi:hypothetical protein
MTLNQIECGDKMKSKWVDSDEGIISILTGARFTIEVMQPRVHSEKNNWVYHVHNIKNKGTSLSFESGKIDAIIDLRKEVETLVENLGGSIKWT